MKYNTYTKNSPLVSEIGLGTWQLGINSGWKNMTTNEVNNMIHQALESGVNFFDTAPNYGNGTSELRLGKTLQHIDRDKIVLNTKFGHTDTGKMNYEANYIRTSLEGSLKRLQVDYLDSLIIHNPPFKYLNGYQTNHYDILEKLKEEGKIKAYGASVDSYKEMKLLMDTTNSEVMEVFFNILHQDAAKGFALAKQKGVSIIAKIPLDSGWLTGKYDKYTTFEGVRSRWSKIEIQTRAKLVNRIKEIVNQEVNLAPIALAFCLAYDAVTTIIPGSINTTQLNNNLESTTLSISKKLVKQLEAFYEKEVEPLNLPW